MSEHKLIVKEPKDLRTAYASSVVADLEAYAAKHGLDVRKREYTTVNQWDYFGDTCQQTCLEVDAILFSGIVSKINNLEYALIYHSTRNHLEVYMIRPTRREYLSDGDGWISPYVKGDENQGTDCMFGKEFRCVSRAIHDAAMLYHDFGKLYHYDSYTEHLSEGALDQLMDAFRSAEEKHVRREKNNKDLRSKEDRLRESESTKEHIKYVLASLVCDVKRINCVSQDFYGSKKYPISTTLTVDTWIDRTRIICYLDYGPKRLKFNARVELEEVIGEGTPTDKGCWRLDEAHWEPVKFCKKVMSFAVTGELKEVANNILYLLDVVKVYVQAKHDVDALSKMYGIKFEKDE